MNTNALPEAIRSRRTENGTELSAADERILASFDFATYLKEHDDMSVLKAKRAQSDQTAGIEFGLTAEELNASYLGLLSNRDRLTEQSKKWVFNLFLVVGDALAAVPLTKLEEQKNRLKTDPGAFLPQIAASPERRALELLTEVLSKNSGKAKDKVAEYWPLLVDSVAEMLSKLEETQVADAATMRGIDEAAITTAVPQAAGTSAAAIEVQTSEASEKWQKGEKQVEAMDLDQLLTQSPLKFDQEPGLQVTEMDELAVNLGVLIAQALKENPRLKSEAEFRVWLQSAQINNPALKLSAEYLTQAYATGFANEHLTKSITDSNGFAKLFNAVKIMRDTLEANKDNPSFLEESITYLEKQKDDIFDHPQGIAQGVVDKGHEAAKGIWGFVRENKEKLIATAALAGGTILIGRLFSSWFSGDNQESVSASSGTKSGGFWESAKQWLGLGAISFAGSEIITRLWGGKSLGAWAMEQVEKVVDKVTGKITERVKSPVVKALSLFMPEEEAKKTVDELFQASVEQKEAKKDAADKSTHPEAQSSLVGGILTDARNRLHEHLPILASVPLLGTMFEETILPSAEALENFAKEQKIPLIGAGAAGAGLLTLYFKNNLGSISGKILGKLAGSPGLALRLATTPVGLAAVLVGLFTLYGVDKAAAEEALEGVKKEGGGIWEKLAASFDGEKETIKKSSETLDESFRIMTERMRQLKEIWQGNGFFDEDLGNIEKWFSETFTRDKLTEFYDGAAEKLQDHTAEVIAGVAMLAIFGYKIKDTIGMGKTLSYGGSIAAVTLIFNSITKTNTMVTHAQFENFSNALRQTTALMFGNASAAITEYSSRLVEKSGITAASVSTLLNDFLPDDLLRFLTSLGFEVPDTEIDEEQISVYLAEIQKLEPVYNQHPLAKQALLDMKDALDSENRNRGKRLVISSFLLARVSFLGQEAGLQVSVTEGSDHTYVLRIGNAEFAGLRNNPLGEEFETESDTKMRMQKRFVTSIDFIAKKKINAFLTPERKKSLPEEAVLRLEHFQEDLKSNRLKWLKEWDGSTASYIKTELEMLIRAAGGEFKYEWDGDELIIVFPEEQYPGLGSMSIAPLPHVTPVRFREHEHDYNQDTAGSAVVGAMEKLDSAHQAGLYAMLKLAPESSELQALLVDYLARPELMNDTISLVRIMDAARAEGWTVGITATGLYFAVGETIIIWECLKNTVLTILGFKSWEEINKEVGGLTLLYLAPIAAGGVAGGGIGTLVGRPLTGVRAGMKLGWKVSNVPIVAAIKITRAVVYGPSWVNHVTSNPMEWARMQAGKTDASLWRKLGQTPFVRSIQIRAVESEYILLERQKAFWESYAKDPVNPETPQLARKEVEKINKRQRALRDLWKDRYSKAEDELVKLADADEIVQTNRTTNPKSLFERLTGKAKRASGAVSAPATAPNPTASPGHSAPAANTEAPGKVVLLDDARNARNARNTSTQVLESGGGGGAISQPKPVLERAPQLPAETATAEAKVAERMNVPPSKVRAVAAGLSDAVGTATAMYILQDIANSNEPQKAIIEHSVNLGIIYSSAKAGKAVGGNVGALLGLLTGIGVSIVGAEKIDSATNWTYDQLFDFAKKNGVDIRILKTDSAGWFEGYRMGNEYLMDPVEFFADDAFEKMGFSFAMGYSAAEYFGDTRLKTVSHKGKKLIVPTPQHGSEDVPKWNEYARKQIADTDKEIADKTEKLNWTDEQRAQYSMPVDTLYGASNGEDVDPKKLQEELKELHKLKLHWESQLIDETKRVAPDDPEQLTWLEREQKILRSQKESLMRAREHLIRETPFKDVLDRTDADISRDISPLAAAEVKKTYDAVAKGENLETAKSADGMVTLFEKYIENRKNLTARFRAVRATGLLGDEMQKEFKDFGEIHDIEMPKEKISLPESPMQGMVN